ncbi:MAG: ABC transporter ATP-binding protein [Desulfobacterales bacterium]|nr:MAG: ABC transporter ATP-binding protein [Desulfobacterales bacterium]
MPEVILDRISKTIQKKKILDDVSLKIDEGSFVCLLGPAGGGKTTLLKIIAGLEVPSAGAVYFGPENVTGLEPYKRDVSMVFQDFALYPHMSVFKNLASPLTAKKLSKPEIERKVGEVARFLKIDRFLDRKINQLSGGEMQRVAIGRALTKEAQIVLFDEIFVNLDYKLREEMRVEFKALVDELNITTIFSSPDPEDALSLADKIAVVREGQILQYGPRDAVYQYPVDVFTAQYCGYPEMNLVDCTVVKNGGELQIDAESFQIPLPRETLAREITPGSYILGVRPEQIRIMEERQENGVVIPGQMVLTEVIGSDTIVHIDVGRHTIQSFVPGIYRTITDKPVYLNFDTKAMYLFERETGAFVARGT